MKKKRMIAVWDKYCDFCGVRTEFRSADLSLEGPGFHCRTCGKEICPNCAVFPFGWQGEDDPDVSCKKCWKKGKEHRARVKRIDRETDQRYAKEAQKWKKEQVK